jgi:hypothetical protein
LLWRVPAAASRLLALRTELIQEIEEVRHERSVEIKA